MPRPYNYTSPRPLGYRARQAALAKAQRRAALACGALAVALPVALALLLWPHVVMVAHSVANALLALH
jgi:hypothetical protein